MTFHAKVRAVICCALLATSGRPVNAQIVAPVRRDTVTAWLVGRTETAQLMFDYVVSAPRLNEPWGVTPSPITPGRGSPAYLQTTLPLKLGKAFLPAGRFRLWTALDHDKPMLIATRAPETADTAFVASDEVARTELTVERLEPPVNGLYLEIRMTRHGADTIRIVSRSEPGRTIRGVEIDPNTTSVLVLLLGSWKMTTPIAAR